MQLQDISLSPNKTRKEMDPSKQVDTPQTCLDLQSFHVRIRNRIAAVTKRDFRLAPLKRRDGSSIYAPLEILVDAI